MLSNQTRSKILELILALAEGELRTEVNKQVLSEKHSYDPINLFDILSNDQDYILQHHLVNFFKEHTYNISNNNVRILFELFDKDQDQRLSFKEFIESVLPKEDQNLRNSIITRVKKQERLQNQIEYDVIYALIRVYDEELKSFLDCELHRKELLKQDDFSIIAAFKEIDSDSKGYIDSQEKLDRDSDNILTYSEFMNGFYTSDSHVIQAPILKSPQKLNQNRLSQGKSEGTPQKHSTKKQYSNSFQTPVKQQNTSTPIKQQFSQTSPTTQLYSNAKKLQSNQASPYQTYQSTAAKSTGSSFTTPIKSSDDQEQKQIQSQELFSSETKQKKDFKESINHNHINQQISSSSPYKECCASSTLLKSPPTKSQGGGYKKSERLFVEKISQIIDHGKLLENIKNDLAIRKDFNLFDAFNIFDSNRDGIVELKELQNGFEQFHISVSNADTHLLMKRVSKQQNSIFQFNDFVDILLPKNTQFASLLTPRKSLYLHHDASPESVFSSQTYALYRQFLSEFFKGESFCEEIRQDLASRHSFTILDCFKSLEKDNCGFVTAQDFKDQLEKYGVFVSYKDLNPLITRYDPNYKGNSKITYNQFLKELSPKSLKQFYYI